MNKYKTPILTLVMAAMLLMPVASVSHAQGEDEPEEVETSTESTTVETERSPEERAAELEARKEERRSRIEAEVSETKEQRVAGRCNGAQQKLAKALSRSETVETNRTDAYAKISEKLNTLVNRLIAAEVDTALLEEQIEEYDTLVNEFFILLDSYQQALTDATEVDCEEDTEGFLLALEDARATLDDLKAKSKAIRSQVRDTIVATLNDIKDSLSNADDQPEEGDDDSTESDEE